MGDKIGIFVYIIGVLESQLPEETTLYHTSIKLYITVNQTSIMHLTSY